jgi:hypothetical protein
MKVVINECWGGFGLSDIAKDIFKARTGREFDYMTPRDDSDLVWIVENMKSAANGEHAELHVIDVPYEYWHIDEYDGQECIYASHSPIEILR